MKLNFEISKSKRKKLYIQLYDEIKNMIFTKQILPNEKLPSVRQLVNRFSLNSSTVLKAYELLETEGHIYKIPGSGTYVKDRKNYVEDQEQKPIIENFKYGQIRINESINFASATPGVEVFPTKKFQESINKVFHEAGGEALKYHETQGFIGLRKVLAERLKYDFHDVYCSNIHITSGAQQALDLIKKSLLKPTSTLILSRPTYSGAINTFKGSCKIVTVEMLEDGFDMEELEEILNQTNVNFVYTMINFQSPTGIRWSHEKKMKLIELSKEYDFMIIEDDCLSELYFYDNPAAPLKTLDKDNRIIYIKTFSKILIPGMRLAYMIVPKELSPQMVAAKFASDISTSGLNQRALTFLLRDGFLENHLEETRKLFRKKFELIVELIEEIQDLEIYYRPEGGFYIWIILPNFINSNDLYLELKKRGVSILPGNVFYPDGAKDNRIRISFAAVTEDEIKIGIKILNDTVMSFKKINNSSDDFMPII
ncbi:aminotransferase class I [Propionigenium maris DSM 9537]|uniref:Aminotransferase class I n=1 Tax=Propionigenium maris DSM 9537 TaxID=1123000 RepID=A0A9W6GN46_9FUSO|nr:PLP-dependent aminotransferase family protein [Propionigenium maris]GLI57160.1 aminotransferase class I [Propionigenium maris DSM 9537]